LIRGAVQVMKVWPFGAALRGEASNRLMLRWLKTVVVSDEEKAQCHGSGGDQEDERERSAGEASLTLSDIKTGEISSSREKPGGCPLIGQAVSGV
jgi:hypothetical protein